MQTPRGGTRWDQTSNKRRHVSLLAVPLWQVMWKELNIYYKEMVHEAKRFTYVTGHAFILLHQSFVLLVDLEYFADAIGRSFRLAQANS